MAFGISLTLPLALSLLAWPALGIGMALGRRRRSGPAALRDRWSLVGLGVQAIGFGLGFAFHRRLEPAPGPGETVLRWLGVALAWSSVWLAIQAVRVLGRQWSLEARLLPGHRLVREGPYGWVRHPIYTAMLGLLVGTGLNLTPWVVLAGAVALYLAGTHVRTRAEEGLLLRQFGDEYARYTAEVPAVLPRPWGSRPRPPTTSARE